MVQKTKGKAAFRGQQVQQLGQGLFSKDHLLAVVDHQAGHAHHLVAVPQGGEVVEVIGLGGDLAAGCRQTLGGGHQVGTHGAGEGDQDLQVHRCPEGLDGLFRGPVQGLPWAGGVVQPQDEGGKLMAPRHAVEGQARPAAIGAAHPDAGGLGVLPGGGEGELVGELAQGLHVCLQLPAPLLTGQDVTHQLVVVVHIGLEHLLQLPVGLLDVCLVLLQLDIDLVHFIAHGVVLGEDFVQLLAEVSEQLAEEAGVLVLTVEGAGTKPDRLMPYPAVLDPNARNDPAACRVGFPDEDGSSVFAKNALALPCSYRTTAEEYTAGQYGYTHYGQGGLSWGIPYCAGVMALGWQVDPTLTGDEIMRYLLSTAATGTDGNSIIDPVHFVETLETNRST